MIELKEGDIYIFEGELLKLHKSPFNKNNQQTGLRPILKKLNRDELNKLLLSREKNGNVR